MARAEYNTVNFDEMVLFGIALNQMWGPLSESFSGAYPHDQTERPNDRVLFNSCQLLKIEKKC